MTARVDRASTALARHAAFFDRRGAGELSVGDTMDGLSRLGLCAPLSVGFALIINAALGYRTRGRPSLSIDLAQIARGKHPHDSDSFGPDGAFSPDAFDAMFTRAAGGRPLIRRDELIAYLRSNPGGRVESAPGWVMFAFSWLEATVFFWLFADRRVRVHGHDDLVPAVTRRRLARFYDGTLFHARARLLRTRSAA